MRDNLKTLSRCGVYIYYNNNKYLLKNRVSVRDSAIVTIEH